MGRTFFVEKGSDLNKLVQALTKTLRSWSSDEALRLSTRPEGPSVNSHARKGVEGVG